MIISIIVLSVLVFVLCVGLFLCAIKIADLNGSLKATIDQLAIVEESRCRMRALIHNKFNYNLPCSDKYLSIEEITLDREKQKGDVK